MTGSYHVIALLSTLHSRTVQLTHDGRWLTTTDGSSVRVWDAATLTAPVKEFTVAYPLEAASYCPSKVGCCWCLCFRRQCSASMCS